MKSGYKFIWTKRAFKDLEQIIDYLENNFSEIVVKKFLIKLEKRTLMIKENPFLFHSSDSLHKVRKSVLTKQITLYYKVEAKQIFLLSVYNNRQFKKEIN